MIKLCVFDLDGTLLNTLGNIAGNMNATLEAFSLAPYPIENYRYFVGNGSRALAEDALSGRGMNTPEFFAAFYAKFYERYAAHPHTGVTVYDGVFPLFDALGAQGVRIAVCTNKPQTAAEVSLRHFSLEEYISDILGGGDAYPLKPAPDAVLALMEKYGALKEEILFIGDSDVDMKTAVAAGVKGLGALWGFRTGEELAAAGAHALVAHPLDILKYV